MISLEEEAGFYSTMTVFYNAETKEIPTEKEIMRDEYVAEIAFKAGAKSKYVQTEKIKAQIEVLKLTHLRLSVEGIDKVDDTMVFTINELEKQLKELEDENI